MHLIRLAPATAGGNDASDGVSAPVASIARAQALVRQMRGQGPVTVEIAGGTWELAAPALFTDADGGTAAAPITWRAAPGARVVWSGGRRLTGWTVGKHAGQTAWTLDLPEVAAGRWRFTQLFVSGVRRPRPGLPDHRGLASGEVRFSDADPWFRFAPARDRSAEVPGTTGFAPGDLDPAWRNRDDIELHILKYWCDFRVHPTVIDPATGTVSFPVPPKTPVNAWNIGSLVDEEGHGARYRAENVFEALRHPGQWYLDRPAGRLTYLPMPGEQAEHAEMVAPCLPVLLHLQDAAHLRFEGIELRHAQWQRPRDNPGSAQAQFHLPGAVVIERSSNCRLHACHIAGVETWGIEVCRGSFRNRITCCLLTDLGAGGIKVNHEGDHNRVNTSGSLAFRGMTTEAARWQGQPPAPVGPGSHRTLIADNTIRAFGRVYPSATGIWVGDSGGNHLLHNRVEDGYYSGISVGWTWGYAATRTVDNHIDGNLVRRIGQGVLSDLGGIYHLGPAAGSTISRNHVSEVSCYGYGDGGIYPDEGSSFLTVEGNTVLCGGMSTHFSRDLQVRGNLFVSQGNGLHLTRAEPYRSFHAESNVVIAGSQGASTNSVRCTFARNCYAPRPGMTFGGLPFAAWQALGKDAGSVLADPLLLDARSGQLRGDSPALALGYTPPAIPAGPRLAIVPASSDDLPSEATDAPRPIVEARLEVGSAAAWLAQCDRPDPDPEAANSYPYLDGTTPQAYGLVVRNRGMVHARGSLALRWVGSPGVIAGADRLDYDLAPGAATCLEITAHVPQGESMLEAIPVAGDGCLPTGLHFRRRPTTRVARLAAGLALDAVPAALAAHPPQPLHGVDPALAALRLGWTGTDLAVHALITDPDPLNHPTPYAGSDVELHLAMPGTNGRAQTSRGRGNAQVMLVPAVGDHPAIAHIFASGIQPAPGVQLASRRTATGYELWALIPPAISRLTPGDLRMFLLEAVVRPVLPGTTQRRHTNLFGICDGADNSGWAMAEVAG